MKKILITGINGFLGSHLAKELSKQYDVIGLEHKNSDLSRLKELKVKVYKNELDDLNEVFTENSIDVVLHTATLYRQGGKSISSMMDTNIKLPIVLYEHCNEYSVNTFINTDSFFNNSSTEYSYLGEYTLTKRNCLEWLKQLRGSCKVINMKLFHMYGPGDAPSKFVTTIIKRIYNQELSIDLTSGEQQRDFIHVDDVVEAFKVIILNSDFIQPAFVEYQIGMGIPVSIKEFVEIVKEEIKSISKLNFGILPYRKGEMMCSVAKNSDLIKLGWTPKHDCRSGIITIINSL